MNFLKKIVCIQLKFFNKTVVIEGIFKQDSINLYIKTCQISNKFLYYKKKNLEKNYKMVEQLKNFQKFIF